MEPGDPSAPVPSVGEQDLYYLGEGSHRRLWHVLGAHPRAQGSAEGVLFAVWAPNARRVSVTGDFNGWDQSSHPMHDLGTSGVWQLWVPGIGPGARYKYAVDGADDVVRDKADPMGFASELRPRTASVVADLHTHDWRDREWMALRHETDPHAAPMSIYEIHPGSWRRHPDGSWLSYIELADALVPYMGEMGYTHVELMGIAEHPADDSWGYQVTGFYAPTSRHGSPGEFQEFVDRLHQAGIGVLLDWGIAHLATDPHALARFDGTHLYEHADPRRRVHPDWGTFTFDYGRNEVRNYLVANALYWLEEYHIDGLRVDAVSSMLYLDYSREPGEWEPNAYGGREDLEAVAFLKEANEAVAAERTGAVMMAEESTTWPGVSRPTSSGGLGYDFKWNMGWMHDTLAYLSEDPTRRRDRHGMLAFSMEYAFDERFLIALSHDEVVHGKRSLLHKMAGDEWQQFANLRLLHAYQHAQPGKKLMFMGGEWGQRGEWNHNTQLEWDALSYRPHQGVRSLVASLNRMHRDEPELHTHDHDPGGFEWLDHDDAENSVIAFLRRGTEPDDHIVCVLNFTPAVHRGYRIPVPGATAYRERLNSDDALYGGSGVGNGGSVRVEARPYRSMPCSLVLTLPPLGALFLKPVRG
jgi:1,4-alpha-glucan branching enzyme